MTKPAEIVAALGDVSDIVSYATLRAEMVDLFTDLADGSDDRTARIMRKMADTVGTVPYDAGRVRASYNPALLAAVIMDNLHADAADYADAHDFVLTLLDQLREIDLDHPDTQKHIEQLDIFFGSMGRPPRKNRRIGGTASPPHSGPSTARRQPKDR